MEMGKSDRWRCVNSRNGLRQNVDENIIPDLGQGRHVQRV